MALELSYEAYLAPHLVPFTVFYSRESCLILSVARPSLVTLQSLRRTVTTSNPESPFDWTYSKSTPSALPVSGL